MNFDGQSESATAGYVKAVLGNVKGLVKPISRQQHHYNARISSVGPKDIHDGILKMEMPNAVVATCILPHTLMIIRSGNNHACLMMSLKR